MAARKQAAPCDDIRQPKPGLSDPQNGSPTSIDRPFRAATRRLKTRRQLDPPPHAHINLIRLPTLARPLALGLRPLHWQEPGPGGSMCARTQNQRRLSGWFQFAARPVRRPGSVPTAMWPIKLGEVGPNIVLPSRIVGWCGRPPSVQPKRPRRQRNRLTPSPVRSPFWPNGGCPLAVQETPYTTLIHLIYPNRFQACQIYSFLGSLGGGAMGKNSPIRQSETVLDIAAAKAKPWSQLSATPGVVDVPPPRCGEPLVSASVAPAQSVRDPFCLCRYRGAWPAMVC